MLQYYCYILCKCILKRLLYEVNKWSMIRLACRPSHLASSSGIRKQTFFLRSPVAPTKKMKLCPAEVAESSQRVRSLGAFLFSLSTAYTCSVVPGEKAVNQNHFAHLATSSSSLRVGRGSLPEKWRAPSSWLGVLGTWTSVPACSGCWRSTDPLDTQRLQSTGQGGGPCSSQWLVGSFADMRLTLFFLERTV